MNSQSINQNLLENFCFAIKYCSLKNRKLIEGNLCEGWVQSNCFFLRIFVFSQSGDHPEEDVKRVAIIPRKIWPYLAINRI